MDLYTSQEITQLIILAIVLLVVLFVARIAFRLTMSMMRMGCLLIFLVFVGAGLYIMLR